MGYIESEVLSAPGKTRGDDASSSTRALPPPIIVPEIDPHWINLDTIRSWMKVCDDEHNCLDFDDFGVAPAWLIDVGQECLISPASLPGRPRYCALSYVWGQVETSKLTKAMQKDFCRPGAFSPGNTSVLIPKTVRHAMSLVKALGEKYLWIDSFCTLQDDRTLLSVELRNMGAIYNRAYLTIVAATGWDANEGLRGLKNISQRRHLAGNFADDLQKYTNQNCMIWNSRGWTFQEREFSRRMIMFCDQTLLWICSACRMDEAGNVSWSSMQHKPGDGYPAWRLLHEPPVTDKDTDETYFDRQLDVYLMDIVSSFNIRNFSYVSDLPLAFDGIAFYLTQTAPPKGLFARSLSWGLPLAHFLRALTWSTDGEDLRPRSSESQFPSWSWFAWEGTLTASREWYHESFSGFSELSSTKPMCTYIFTDSPCLSLDSPSVSSDEGGRYVRVVAERFTSLAVKWHIDAYGFYFIDSVWPNRFGVIYPDQLVDFGDEKKAVELLGITTFEATSDATTMKRLTFVKALWIVRDQAGSLSDNPHGLAYRRGVAIVQKELWDEYAVDNGQKSTVILA